MLPCYSIVEEDRRASLSRKDCRRELVFGQISLVAVFLPGYVLSGIVQDIHEWWTRDDTMTTILHIEDNPANKILIERVLEPQGYSIVYAPDGESGIIAALEHMPDLILLDMGLPDIDGQTVATLIKQMPQLANTPVVVITAWPAEKAMETAERYGLTGCILKPIDVKSFPQQIAGFLAGERQPTSRG